MPFFLPIFETLPNFELNLRLRLSSLFLPPQRKLLCCRISDLRRWWGVVRHPSFLPSKMGGENQPLVTDEPVEFEKQPVAVQDFRKSTHHCRGMCVIYLDLINKNPKMSTLSPVALGNTGISPGNTPEPPFRNPFPTYYNSPSLSLI